jgi:hypothetical protein
MITDAGTAQIARNRRRSRKIKHLEFDGIKIIVNEGNTIFQLKYKGDVVYESINNPINAGDAMSINIEGTIGIKVSNVYDECETEESDE